MSAITFTSVSIYSKHLVQVCVVESLRIQPDSENSKPGAGSSGPWGGRGVNSLGCPGGSACLCQGHSDNTNPAMGLEALEDC